MDPNHIFPPEIWVEIFNKVENPQEWLNLYNSSPYFQELAAIRDTRSTVLFPLVFSVMFPFYYPDVQQALPLRRVTSKWRMGVDRELENSDHNNMLFLTELKRKYSFSDPASIRSFLETFAAHPGNPIIGRSISLNFETANRPRVLMDYKNLVLGLLAKFGDCIKQVEIRDFTRGSKNFHNFAHRLRAAVKLMPKLEGLTVRVVKFSGADRDNNGRVVPFCQSKSPGPIIPNLNSLSFSASFFSHMDRGFVEKLQNMILRLCCNPDSLRIVQVRGVPGALLRFPNLEDARVSLERGNDYHNLSKAPWPLLSKLVLDWESGRASKVVGCAEHFKGTLTELTISSHFGPLTGGISKFTVELPHLQRLCLSNLIACNIDSNPTSLEELSVSAGMAIKRTQKGEFLEVTGWNGSSPLKHLRPSQIIKKKWI